MTTTRNDRINGILYGVAVGDALGAPLEFMTSHEIKQKHGTVMDMIGGGWLNVDPGEITDDTQMTIAVAEGIVESPTDPVTAIGRRFIEWYRSGPKDVGGTCGQSILYAARVAETRTPTPEEWYTAAYRTHITSSGRSAGNGSLMRTAYPAMYYRNPGIAILVANDVSRMTHYDPQAAFACEIYTEMLHCMIKLNHGKKYIRFTAASNNYDYTEPRLTGYVVDSFATALHCILTTDSLEEALVKAVNLGGDADTVGAITGGLAGALYGYSAIPERWLACLDRKITAQIDRLNAISVKQWEV